MFGGTVGRAPSIVHGKTSPLSHDASLLYANVPQNVNVARYHSLIASATALPACLAVVSSVANNSEMITTDNANLTKKGDSIIMGIRHVEFVIEGVQFHPESVASEYGMILFGNFLAWDGGTWDSLQIHRDRVRAILPSELRGVPGLSCLAINDVQEELPSQSILSKITAKRQQRIRELKSLPTYSLKHLERSLSLTSPPRIKPLKDALSACSEIAVMAEIKRKSPSKGDIAPDAHAPTIALEYAKAGASVISVLTEPDFFGGCIEDLRQVRQALAHLPHDSRPAVLRKDFILEPMQIAEARLYGADTVLLIVSILSQPLLLSLISYARLLGMEPLVEVASSSELSLALEASARIIGVNNRDLNTFKVSMDRTVILADILSKHPNGHGVMLCALSGIKGREDVEVYESAGARAVLVGEALMQSHDKSKFIRLLKGLPAAMTESRYDVGPKSKERYTPVVKICGITCLEDAECAVDNGADMLGFIFVPLSSRFVTPDLAKSIVASIRKQSAGQDLVFGMGVRKPAFVGVFRDMDYDSINLIVREVGLDIVQLHGDEDPAMSRLISVPVLKAIHVIDSTPLLNSTDVMGWVLDTGIHTSRGSVSSGGSGTTFDWSVISHTKVARIDQVLFVAGGLTPNNVVELVKEYRPFGVDVCGGVEGLVKGRKDPAKLKAFLENLKNII